MAVNIISFFLAQYTGSSDIMMIKSAFTRISYVFLLVFFISEASYGLAITNLVGDKDSFGTEKPDGSWVSVAEVIVPGGEDGDFDLWGKTLHSWTHVFEIPATETILSSTLTIATLDLEDDGEGDGLGGAPYDVTLFLDSMEVPKAFDDTFSPDTAGSTLLKPNLTVFDVSDFIPSLYDGELTVLVDTFSGTFKDFISIDYSELVLTTAFISESSLIAMSILGLFCLVFRRMKYNTVPC